MATQQAGWQRELQDILIRHNEQHAHRSKVVSHRTRTARAQALFRCFRLLHAMGFHVRPAGLGGRHVEWLMRYWTADAAVPEKLAATGAKVAARAAPYSAAYIQQQLSHVRVFGAWIGKPGLVLPAGHYVADAGLVVRSYSARSDHSWCGQAVDAHSIVRRVAALDDHVAVQLHVMLAFGLRRKEAVMFNPRRAEVPAHALPCGHQHTGPYLAFLRVRRGTKGGRLRYVAVRTSFQRDALELAGRFVLHEDGHIGRPGLSLKQSLDRFSNVLRSVGISRRSLGVTPHGLRHQFAADLYFDLAAVQPPVRGGDPATDSETLRHAYLEVARQLGHGRPQISNAYLGAPPRAKPSQNDPS
ncbi:integrase domain-containing protein [Massilia sp. TS11]|uniref:integrase domain-containing protein n=1 Tax=Massilia sp. TS11 TaxID=2908003 RepID=UPI001EDAC331|nr:integrase domain-containing protein [Massilia sp. TS11]MCG2583871.1 integrase domain-containing protein [Massilia sp. TS11]